MNEQMHSGIAEAMRLTRQGRLDGATAATSAPSVARSYRRSSREVRTTDR